MNPQPTEAAVKAAKLIAYETGGSFTSTHKLRIMAQLIDRASGLPGLTVVALAAQSVLDAGRPHAGRTTIYPDGCECDCCEAWHTLKSAVDALATKETQDADGFLAGRHDALAEIARQKEEERRQEKLREQARREVTRQATYKTP